MLVTTPTRASSEKSARPSKSSSKSQEDSEATGGGTDRFENIDGRQPPHRRDENSVEPVDHPIAFLEALDSLVQALNESKVSNLESAVYKITTLCKHPQFDFRMAFKGCKISRFPNLKEEMDQTFLKENATPISLLLEVLKDFPRASSITIDLLSLIPNPSDALARPAYRKMEDSEPPSLTNNLEVIDWLLENGANRSSYCGKTFHSSLNISKLFYRLINFNESNAEATEPRRKVCSFFTAAIQNQELLSVRILKQKLTPDETTEDAVAVLLNPHYLNDLPTEMVLELLEIAQRASFDFKAFGRDYGVHNLLYRTCRSPSSPPDQRIVQFLINAGLSPYDTITRFGLTDGLSVDDSGEDFEYSSPMPLTTVALVQENIAFTKSAIERGFEHDIELVEKLNRLLRLLTTPSQSA